MLDSSSKEHLVMAVSSLAYFHNDNKRWNDKCSVLSCTVIKIEKKKNWLTNWQLASTTLKTFRQTRLTENGRARKQKLKWRKPERHQTRTDESKGRVFLVKYRKRSKILPSLWWQMQTKKTKGPSTNSYLISSWKLLCLMHHDLFF